MWDKLLKSSFLVLQYLCWDGPAWSLLMSVTGGFPMCVWVCVCLGVCIADTKRHITHGTYYTHSCAWTQKNYKYFLYYKALSEHNRKRVFTSHMMLHTSCLLKNMARVSVNHCNLKKFSLFLIILFTVWSLHEQTNGRGHIHCLLLIFNTS